MCHTALVIRVFMMICNMYSLGAWARHIGRTIQVTRQVEITDLHLDPGVDPGGDHDARWRVLVVAARGGLEASCSGPRLGVG